MRERGRSKSNYAPALDFIRYSRGRGKRESRSAGTEETRMELVIRATLLTSSARSKPDHIAFVINRFGGFPLGWPSFHARRSSSADALPLPSTCHYVLYVSLQISFGVVIPERIPDTSARPAHRETRGANMEKEEPTSEPPRRFVAEARGDRERKYTAGGASRALHELLIRKLMLSANNEGSPLPRV